MASNDALLQLLTVLVQELKSSLSSRMDQIINKIEKIEESRLHNEKYIQKLASDLQKQQQELTALKNYCQQIPKNTPTTSTTTVPVQQSPPERGIRRNNLIITGIDIGEQDPNIFISNFLTAHFAIKQDALLAIQKLSTNSDTINTKGEKFLITLKSVWDAQIIYNQRLQKLRNLGIYISEDLTPTQASLFYKARQLKKAKFINTTWTKEGRVFAKRGVGQEPFEITDEHPLLKELSAPLISIQQEGSTSNTQQHGSSDAQIKQQKSSSASTSSPSDFTNETAKLTAQDSTGSLSNFNSEDTQQEESEEEDIKQMMEEAIQGALTRATRRKRKKNTKEMKEEATIAPK